MKKNAIPMIAILGAGLLILIAFFGRVILDPDSYLFSASGDAVKSYYNFSYYLKYDSGFAHDGINYPYGDHLQYINSHPLYLQIIKFLDAHIYPLTDHGVGILNLTMIFSLLFAIPFIYLVLREFSLPLWYAAVISLFILFLSPQVDRLGGHFEMVYAFFIPLYWYLLIRWQRARRKRWWTLMLLGTALVGGFTSAYYAAFLSIFTFAILLVQLWNHRKALRGYLGEGIHLMVIALLPLLIVRGLVSISDWVDDRPDNPWGFFIFHSNIFSIFLPSNSILNQLTHGILDRSYQWEGRAYVGLPASLLAFTFLITFLLQLFGGKRPTWRSYFPNRKLNLYLAASVIVLLFSMCIPFKWGLGFLTELLPLLKQFRCLGRFAWIFYYVFSLFTATYIYYLYRLIRKKGYRVQAIALLLITLSIWGLEAASRVKNSTAKIFNKNEILSNEKLDIGTILDESGRSTNDFQSIFFLPFANTCGDKMQFERGLDAFTDAMRCSDQTGIPIIQSFSPRISLSQAMSSIQLLADSTIYKKRVADMNHKPVLMVIGRKELNRQEQHLLDRAEVFWSGDHFSLANLPVQSFNQGYDLWRVYAMSVLERLKCEEKLCSTVDTALVDYTDFEEFTGDHSFTGSGAKYLKKGSLELLNKNLQALYGTSEVEFSFWLYVDHRTDNMPTPELLQWDQNGNLLHREKLNSREVHNVDGMWVRIGKKITPEPGIRYQITIKGKQITVDDILLKPDGASVVISHENGDQLFDNFRFPVADDL